MTSPDTAIRWPDPLPILFEDDGIVVIDKPAGLAVAPGRGEHASIIHVLGDQLNLPVAGTTDPRLRLVHRLDKDISGVFLLALGLVAAPALAYATAYLRPTPSGRATAALCGGFVLALAGLSTLKLR